MNSLILIFIVFENLKEKKSKNFHFHFYKRMKNEF